MCQVCNHSDGSKWIAQQKNTFNLQPCLLRCWLFTLWLICSHPEETHTQRHSSRLKLPEHHQCNSRNSSNKQTRAAVILISRSEAQVSLLRRKVVMSRPWNIFRKKLKYLECVNVCSNFDQTEQERFSSEREWSFRLSERELLSPFPHFGNGNGNEKLHSQLLGMGTGMRNRIPDIWQREWDLHSRLLGTEMRHWYSRGWSATTATCTRSKDCWLNSNAQSALGVARPQGPL